jgi:glutamine---fructose-6-phosphate transaminase (isomerizing)
MKTVHSAAHMPTFESEIHETPAALRRLLDYWRSEGRRMAARVAAEHRPVREVVFTGMGSSVNAAYPAKYLLARHGIAARVEPASELFYSLLHTVSPETLVIATSQSGETIETNKVLASLDAHPHVLAVANNEASPMATSGRPFFPLKAGPETKTSSKSYTNTLVLLYLIAEQIAGGPAVADSQWDGLAEVAASTLAQSEDFVARMLEHWGSLERLQVVARGPSLASAHEFALILAENSSVLAQPLDGGSFRHGFNYLRGDFNKLLFLTPESPTAALSAAIAGQMARRGRRAVVLSSAGTVAARATTDGDGVLHLPLPSVGADLAPFCEILPLEVLAMRMAEREGRDPGTLESKVTREE